MSQLQSAQHAPITYRYHVVLAHPTMPCLLLLHDRDGWSLPHWTTDTLDYWQNVAHINRRVQEQLGLRVTTLRCLTPSLVPNDATQLARVYLLESHGRDWTPPVVSRWVDRADLADLRLVQPELRSLLDSYLAETQAGQATALPAWMRPGWFATANDWLREQCAALGLIVSEPIEQMRTWERSCVLRARTSGGDVYLKAVPPLFAHEPRLTRFLAELDPIRCAPVLALDDARGLLLLPDFGGRLLANEPQLGRWEQALHSLAQLQISLIGRVDALLALGCANRPLDLLDAQIDALLNDPAAIQTGAQPHFSADERMLLQALAPQLQAACAALSRCGLPTTLEHGDLGPWNISVADTHSRFFDWSDSSVAHPFFSTLLLLENAAAMFDAVPDWRARLRAAYLRPWSAFAPPDQLVAAFELAQPLAAAHYAISYQRYMLPHIARRWEMHYMQPYYLRLLLRLLTHSPV